MTSDTNPCKVDCIHDVITENKNLPYADYEILVYPIFSGGHFGLKMKSIQPL